MFIRALTRTCTANPVPLLVPFSAHTVHYSEPTIKREPHDEMKSYVDLDHQKQKYSSISSINSISNIPEIQNINNPGLSVVPVNMDEQVTFGL